MIETRLLGILETGHLTHVGISRHSHFKKIWRVNWRSWWDCCLFLIEATARDARLADVARFEKAWDVTNTSYARFAACHGIRLQQLRDPEGDAWKASRGEVLWLGDTPLDALALFAERQGGRII